MIYVLHYLTERLESKSTYYVIIKNRSHLSLKISSFQRKIEQLKGFEIIEPESFTDQSSMKITFNKKSLKL